MATACIWKAEVAATRAHQNSTNERCRLKLVEGSEASVVMSVGTGRLCLAGAPGFEPGNGGFKVRCLTAWRRPTRGGRAAALTAKASASHRGGRPPMSPLPL